MRLRRKPNLDVRMRRCAEAGILIDNPENYKDSWNEAFGAEKIYLELGCGKGGFTVAEAARCGVLFLAVERNADALVIAMERAMGAGADNIRFLNGRVEDIDIYFGCAEIERIYINFCDPWPANRHTKRRLTYRTFLEKYSKILKPGGEVRLKTDNEALFEFSLKELEACGYIIKHTSRNLHETGVVGIMTDYEEKYHNKGIPICSVTAEKSIEH